MNSKINTSFKIILLIGFLLEAAGYLAFPFLALRLRNHFGFSEKEIGTLFLVSIWIRPIASILGGILSTYLSSVITFLFACLFESFCFGALALGNQSHWAIAAIIIGNVGFSLWSPNLYSLAQTIQTGLDSTRAISLLVAFINLGGIIGATASGFAAQHYTQHIFLIAAALFVLIIPLSWNTISSNSIATKKSHSYKGAFAKKIILKNVFLIFSTLFFWASYNQFNTFFSIFVQDSSQKMALVGISFSLLSVTTTLFSLSVNRYSSIRDSLVNVTVLSALFLSGCWLFMTATPAIISILIFIIALGISEASWATILSKQWSDAQPSSITLMQSINFAFRNIGMGMGAWIGGLTYPHYSLNTHFSKWGMQNGILLITAAVGLFYHQKRVKNHG